MRLSEFCDTVVLSAPGVQLRRGARGRQAGGHGRRRVLPSCSGAWPRRQRRSTNPSTAGASAWRNDCASWSLCSAAPRFPRPPWRGPCSPPTTSRIDPRSGYGRRDARRAEDRDRHARPPRGARRRERRSGPIQIAAASGVLIPSMTSIISPAPRGAVLTPRARPSGPRRRSRRRTRAARIHA